ncbi:MAG: glycine cleavage system protein H [bacterium]
MAIIEKFLGKRVQIPEDRQYEGKQGLWVMRDGSAFTFGLSEPALVLLGGINGLDWLASDGEAVEKGASVAFAITAKIMYIESPLSGRINYNGKAKEEPSLVNQEPYGGGWLFKIVTGESQEAAAFLDADSYLESLRATEGFKNPQGLKGGVSGICKAVYSGIRAQKI